MIAQALSTDILVTAAKEIFETMVFMNVGLVTHDKGRTTDDVVLSTITFSGDVEGCLGVCCDQASATAIALNMLGMSPNDPLDTADIDDAMGEIANMVMGSIKSLTSDIFGEIQLSIPTVIKGAHIEYQLGEASQEMHVNVTLAIDYRADLSFLWRSA
ncbi:chemotaxis protein CheX [Planctomycetota bacterium]